MSDLVLRGASSLYPMPGEGPVRGGELQSIAAVENADVWFDGGRVGGFGDSPEKGATEIDASGCTVVPGFVDCHTHLPFHGWRADEDAARLSGKRYETLHKEEGGIFRSARLLAEATDDEVLSFSEGLAMSMLARGTTTFETKSGYGLSVDRELRQLRLARALSQRVPQHVETTCLACHAIPPNKSAGEWTGEAAEKLLPQAAEEGLAAACDIYVESIAFALEHAARLAEVAKDLGLRMRIHADQLEDGQGAAFAARWDFATADHLNHTSLAAVGDLAESNTTAVLLPGATFTLRQQKKPPVRNLLDEGAVVALGTDLNPGTSPVHSMPFVIALACRLYGMRPLEALAAATVNAAHALGLTGTVGRLAPGSRGDAVILDLPSFEQVAYRIDTDPVLAVVCAGRLEHVADRARERVVRSGAN
jgi:imidazolonepropionase